ncbi:nickel pincer cofactor biosynthesis protein LarC [uncultured Fibrobacter sp.]|uniref:nickel pincer cofactor biosynthesis protein LarC n=1 Tax=uncultured Fibrobacter sp. TaxID=261512 RepID=UPI002620E3EB|nr:nickel pincer cofactor biosynthesis protein LarC [uncultured Fibrobacter sp.]
MKYLYLDGSCGISGDMTVAALLNLGASREKLDAAIAGLGLEGVHVHVEHTSSYSIAGLSFAVHVHGHDADHVHSHEEGYVEHHHHEHGEHCHGASTSSATLHHHEHRHLSEVYEILDRAANAGAVTPRALETAKKIFRIIAEAEAKAHGVPVEEVHFHEVGAVDSIVDILAVAVLADDLGIENCIVTGLNEGSGFVETQHGQLPIPVPAVAHIAEAAGIALHITETKGEMVTPTGAGIVAALRTSERLPPNYKILKSGVGLGKRDFGRANFLRAQIIEDSAGDKCVDATSSATGCTPVDCNVFQIEANIDDSTPEELGYAMEKLFEAGTRDVHFIPCYMKKNRMGTLLCALADSEHLAAVEKAIFLHTSTVGVRRFPVERTCMARNTFEVKTEFGKVRVKKSVLGDIEKVKPEFDDLKACADKAGVPIREIQKAVEKKLH